MRLVAFLLATTWVASAAVEGVVTNQTTGKPQGGVVVTLVELGSGMKNIGSVKSSPDGKFSFPVERQAGAPHLIQAQHDGVNYNRMLPPGSPGTAVAVEVYDASPNVRDAQVSQDMFLLETTDSEMVVSERIVYTNTGKVTYQDPDGTVKFFVPTGVTSPIQVRIVAPQGMPITRQAEKGKEPNVYVIRYPIKPGETNIDVGYSMPMSGSQGKFAGKVLHKGGQVRIIAPSGVKLEGPLEAGGQIPGTSAMAYTLRDREFVINVSGTGSLRASAPAAEGGDESGPGIEARKPLIYDRLTWVLIFSFAMLTVGFIMLFRRSVPVRAGAKR